MADTVRVLRVVEYIGDREWVEKAVGNSLHGTKVIVGKGEIRAATIGAYPELLRDGIFGEILGHPEGEDPNG